MLTSKELVDTRTGNFSILFIYFVKVKTDLPVLPPT